MNWQSLGLEVTRPLALWGLALALPLVVFHLYHRRRVKVVVPCGSPQMSLSPRLP